MFEVHTVCWLAGSVEDRNFHARFEYFGDFLISSESEPTNDKIAKVEYFVAVSAS